MAISRLGVGLAVGGAVTALGAVAVLPLIPPRFPAGAQAGPVQVGRMTLSEAQQAVSSWWDGHKAMRVVLEGKPLGSHRITLTATKAGISLDPVATVAEAARLMPPWRFPSNSVAPQFPPAVTARWTIDKAAADRLVARLAKDEKPPGQPKVRYDKGAITVRRGNDGVALDRDKTIAAIEQALLTGAGKAQAAFVPAPPTQTDEALSKIKVVLASYRTSFPERRNRMHNIQIATEALDSQVIMPGEVFSYNKVVGPRTARRGFELAPTFVKGKHVPGFGGGVCQVSSTLYNTALLSGLKIVERHNHQMPVGYVPIGRDATVDFPGKDLKFRNDTDAPIAVVSEYRPGHVQFRILGAPPKVQRTFKLVVTDRRSFPKKVQEIRDPKLPPGAKRVEEKGSNGYRCRTWRYVYEGDTLVAKESLGGSYYTPSTRIIRVGPAAIKPGLPGAAPGPGVPGSAVPVGPAGGRPPSSQGTRPGA